MATGMITGKATGKIRGHTIVVTQKVAGIMAAEDMFGYRVIGDN
jgi:hypothetical protein